MGKIHNITIFRDGNFQYEQVKDGPPKPTPENGDSPAPRFNQSEPDKVVYSGDGSCALQIQTRFGDKPPATLSRGKCGPPNGEAWAEANSRVALAKGIVSQWLYYYAEVVKTAKGNPVYQFDSGGVHGVITVKFTSKTDLGITAIDFESQKSGFKARIEDPKMFAFLWGNKLTVANKS